MARVIGATVLLVSMAGIVSAGVVPGAPEIDATTGAAAIGLLAGGLIILRARRKKQ